MAGFHIREETKDPDVVPTVLLEHWINTNTGEHWIATGTSAIGDWEQQGAGRVYSQNISIPSGGGEVTVTHNLSTHNIQVTVWDRDQSPEEIIEPSVSKTSGNEQDAIDVGWDFQKDLRVVVSA